MCILTVLVAYVQYMALNFSRRFVFVCSLVGPCTLQSWYRLRTFRTSDNLKTPHASGSSWWQLRSDIDGLPTPCLFHLDASTLSLITAVFTDHWTMTIRNTSLISDQLPFVTVLCSVSIHRHHFSVTWPVRYLLQSSAKMSFLQYDSLKYPGDFKMNMSPTETYQEIGHVSKK